jgi:hypothetical protein
VVVSGSVTSETLTRVLAAGEIQPSADKEHLEQFERALAVLTKAHYGAGGPVDESALDDSLSIGERQVRRLAMKRRWAAKAFRRVVRRVAPVAAPK